MKANHGKIRIGQTQRTLSYPEFPGFEVIPAFSRGKKPWKELSPFFIGPVVFKYPNGETGKCGNLESYWQSYKVWDKVDRQSKADWKWPAETHVEKLTKDSFAANCGIDIFNIRQDSLVPNEKWYLWHDALIKHDKAVRRPNGKKVPLFAWWYDEEKECYEKLNTIEARRKIYIPTLKTLYRAHPVYQQLLTKFRKGTNIMLVEPDGPLRQVVEHDGSITKVYPQGKEFDLATLYEWIDKMNYGDEGFPERYAPFGHGAVLAICLLEDA